MRSRSSIRLFMLLVFAVPVSAYALFIYLEKSYKTLPVLGKTVMEGGKEKDHAIPAFELTDQNGHTADLSAWDNRIVVADFFFTHCASICPKMTKSLQKVQVAFTEDEIFFASFSIDPERDSAARLARYAKDLGVNTSNWQFLTGDKRTIYKLARNGFMVVATDGDGGAADFIHSEKLVLIDKHKRVRGYYDGTDEKEVTTLIDDIRLLKHEK